MAVEWYEKAAQQNLLLAQEVLLKIAQDKEQKLKQANDATEQKTVESNKLKRKVQALGYNKSDNPRVSKKQKREI